MIIKEILEDLGFTINCWYSETKYWILHRISPWHRYHVIKPRTLTPNYYDQDTRLEACIFEMVEDYLEEAEDTIVPDDVTAEFKKLVNWYHKDWPKRDDIKTDGTPVCPYPDDLKDHKYFKEQEDGTFLWIGREDPEFLKWCEESRKNDVEWQTLMQSNLQYIILHYKKLWI